METVPPMPADTECKPKTAATADPTQRRRSRSRVVDKLESLRTLVQRLERFSVALPLVDDTDAVWDEFIDDDTKRVRDAMRRILPATAEIQSLLVQKQKLQALLTEHKLASYAIERMLRQSPDVDPWDANVTRWKQLARVCFRPRKVEQCIAELNAAMVEANNFTYAQDRQSSGISFMGWKESRRIIESSSTFQFCVHKTVRGANLPLQTTMGWRTYTEPELYQKTIMNGRGHSYLDVLQRLSPTLFVVLYHEQYEDMPVNFHALAVLAQVDSDDGVTQYIRSIDAPDLMNAFDGPDDVWVHKFYWKQMKILNRNKPHSHGTDLHVSLSGSIRGHDLSYVSFWLFELLAVLVRSECLLSGRSLLKF